MSQNILRFLVVLAGLLASAGFSFAQSIQQPSTSRAATSNSVSVFRGTTYYENRAVTSCTGFINCFLNFEPLPSTISVQITQVSCAMDSTNAPIGLTLSNFAATGALQQRAIKLPTTPYVYAPRVFSSTYAYFVNMYTQVNVIFQKGSQPYLNFYTSGSAAYSINMDCTLTGKIN